MKRICLIVVLFAFVANMASAGILKFSPYVKYRIESIYSTGSSVALGANHNINSPLCLERYSVLAKAEDCYWKFDYKGDGKYSICNASTNEYITLDDNYASTPMILRYIHLSTEIEGDASLWYIKKTDNDTYGEVIYFQNAYNESFFFNLRSNSYVMGAYGKSPESVPYGINELFRIYDENDELYIAEEISEDTTVVEEHDSLALLPIECPIVHVYRADGKLDAFPQNFIVSSSVSSDSVVIKAINGQTYAYASYEVDSISENAPIMPHFNSFKFNNKYNHHIVEDAQGIFYGDTLITAYVVGIGKDLRPSFKLDDDVQAWIADKPQQSKVSSVRFTCDITYTIARRGYNILRQTVDSVYQIRPYGSETTVRVDFATDHSVGQYTVPTIYITTDDGTMITSKSYYWKAKIRIDGAGVFPDMPETAMEIKGRGNTSWTSTGKAPYHMKFATAVKPLGLTKGKHWNLIANAQRRSMTSNAIAMKMAQLVETAAPNHEIPVDLYINGEYRGSYNLTEKIGFSNNSVDLQYENYATMLELDRYYDETYKFRTTRYNLPVNIKEPDFSDKESTTLITQDLIKASFERLTNALYDGEDISGIVDLDYLARFLFVDEFTGNFELMHPKSTFVYNENILNADSKFIFGPVWDFDWAYGYCNNSNYFTSYDTVDYFQRTDGDGYPWVYKQRYCGEKFDKIYYNLWYDFVNSGKLDELIDFCDDYYDFAARSFTHDNTKWGRGDASTYAEVTKNAKKWLRTRANHVLDYMTNTLGYGSKNYITSPLKPKPGDVNGDGRITTADVVCVFNYILNLPNEEFNFLQADMDSNDIITVSDLLAVRNLIGSAKSKGFYGLPLADATVSLGTVSETNNGVNLPLNIIVDEGDYCGLQFDLTVPAGMTVDNIDLSSSVPDFDVSVSAVEKEEGSSAERDCYRVSIYSSAKHLFPRGSSEINIEMGWPDGGEPKKVVNFSLSNVMFVDAVGEDERAESRTAIFTPDNITGIDGVVSFVKQIGGKLVFETKEKTLLPIYGVDGRLYKIFELAEGQHSVTLPKGIYLIDKQKVVVE